MVKNNVIISNHEIRPDPRPKLRPKRYVTQAVTPMTTITTHRLNQAVCAAFLHITLANGRRPHTAVGPGLRWGPGTSLGTRIPTRPGTCWQAGDVAGAVAPHGLLGTFGPIHYDHRGVEQPPSPTSPPRYAGGSGACCCVIGPGRRGQGGHAATADRKSVG